MLKIQDGAILAFLEYLPDNTWQSGVFNVDGDVILCAKEAKTQEEATQSLQSFIDAQNLTTKKVHLVITYEAEFS